MSNYQRKKRDGSKWALTSITLFLVIAAIVVFGLELFGQGKVKPSEWFKKPAEQTEQLPENESPADEPKDAVGTSYIFVLK